jgi:hypothetical protein
MVDFGAIGRHIFKDHCQIPVAHRTLFPLFPRMLLRNLKLGKVVGRFSAARFNEPTPFILVPCLNVETFCFSRLIFRIFDEMSEIYLLSETFFEFRLSIGRLTVLSSPRKITLPSTNP